MADIIEELHLINSNLQILGQILQQRIANLMLYDLPRSNNDLLTLYKQHKVRICLI